MGFAFHQLCPRCNWTLNPTAPTAIRFRETIYQGINGLIADNSEISFGLRVMTSH